MLPKTAITTDKNWKKGFIVCFEQVSAGSLLHKKILMNYSKERLETPMVFDK